MSGDTIPRWQTRICAAAAAGIPLCIRGSGSKDFYGAAPVGEILDTTEHAGIVDYDPTELVLTARAGTRLTEIEEAMSENGQMLGFEPPHFGPRATLGGCIAAGLSGPRRPHAGAVRDFVLGVRIIDGTGEDLRFGGRVMKNVAGFDVSRLMAGSLGTLGVIHEVSIKCQPRAKVEASIGFECSADEAIRWVNEWAGKPYPISATCFHAGRLAVRLSGSVPGVDAAMRKLGGTTIRDGGAFWPGIREQTHPYFAPALRGRAPLWRLAVKPTTPFRDLGGDQMIEWGGAVRWLVARERVDPARLREWAHTHGGHATLFRAEATRFDVFPRPSDAQMALHTRLKAVFDPAGILNPGRLFNEL